MKIHGNIVDIFNKRIYSGEIQITDGKIISIAEVDYETDRYIMPGFIDAHIHIESSMLPPSEFARIAVKHGTIGTISDPHEIANVLGLEGVQYMINNGKKVPLKFHFGAPSCVPATAFETAGAVLDALKVKTLLENDDIFYLSEVMNFPGVLNKDQDLMDKIEFAALAQKPIDGHAPGLTGQAAVQYINAGITTDHECFTYEEALFKIQHGMQILIREGSAAKNFDALFPLIDEFPVKTMLCSDDKHPDELINGHINMLVKRALELDLDFFNVLYTACIAPVLHYKMKCGLLRPGDAADFIVLNNLEDWLVYETWIDGELVYSEGKSHFSYKELEQPNKFNCDKINASQLDIDLEDCNAKIIHAIDNQIVTHKLNANISVSNGEFTSPELSDILKIAVINRYQNKKPAVALIHGFGLLNCAIASSVAHDSHNIVAVGSSDGLIAKAVNLIVEHKGGVAFASPTEEEILPLPIAGLMSNLSYTEVASIYKKIDHLAKRNGSKLTAPFMTLSFMALLVIPQLKLSDKGLFDANLFAFTSLKN